MVKNILGAALFCIFLVSCGGGGSGSSSSSQGTLVINLTDAPAASFTAINVTVYAVRVHASADAGETGAGWHQLTLPAPVKINLLNFRNILLTLGQMSLPAGHYQQIRLLLVPNSSTLPFNDSVVPASGPRADVEMPLDIRPEEMTGIKIIHQFTVNEGYVTELTLDFDGKNSVILRGDGTYMLQPVVTATATQSPLLGYTDRDKQMFCLIYECLPPDNPGAGDTDNRGDQPGEMGDDPPAVGSGAHHCAVLDDGSIKCWGDNNSGQLGTVTGYPDNQGI